MRNTIELPERFVRVQKRIEPDRKHDNFSEWLASVEDKIRQEFD